MHMIFDLDEVNLLSISFRWKSIVNADNNSGCHNHRPFRVLSLTTDPTFVYCDSRQQPRLPHSDASMTLRLWLLELSTNAIRAVLSATATVTALASVGISNWAFCTVISIFYNL